MNNNNQYKKTQNKMNKTNKKVSEAAKAAYESLTCEVLELEAQGVLCASNSPSEPVYGLSQQKYNDGGTL